jgi:hypothetical protein
MKSSPVLVTQACLGQSGSASAKRLEIWRQLVPFAGLARFADENDEEIEAVTGESDPNPTKFRIEDLSTIQIGACQ